MPEMTGTVNCLKIAEAAAFTTIQDAAGETETFILWFGTVVPPQLNAFSRVVHSMWVSVLREAFTNGQAVTVTHASGSAAITNLQLG